MKTKKKNGHRKQKAITIRLPPALAKRLEGAIEAVAARFEKGLMNIKPTLNQLVVDGIARQLEILDKQLKVKR